MRTISRVAPACLAALNVLVLSASAYALPVGTKADLREEDREAPSWDELVAAGVDFKAIVALSNCSGSLVRFTTSKTTDYAMVLTNGHCLSGMVRAGQARVNESSARSFSLLNSTGTRTLGTLTATRMMYGTMTGTDVALYKLSTTYASIASRYGVAPLVIADKRPTAGDPVRIVSGYWRRIYSCQVAKMVPELREGTWTFKDSIRFTQPGCETIGGTSGSPLINADTYEVLGINNTGNESGAMCTVNNPCEVDPATGKTTATKGAAYGQQTHWFYGCINARNDLDLNKPGCTLTKPTALLPLTDDTIPQVDSDEE